MAKKPVFETESCEPTTELGNAAITAHGFCKWDGCSEFKVDKHICSPRGLKKLSDALVRVYAERAKVMGSDIREMCLAEKDPAFHV